MVQAAASAASHPAARLPWRMTLAVTSRTYHVLEALKLDGIFVLLS